MWCSRNKSNIHEDVVRSLASLSRVKGPALLRACGVGHRHRSDPTLLWLWCRPAAVVGSSNWTPSLELPYATGLAQKKKNSTSNKCWKRCGAKETLLHCWWECELVQPLWKRVWRYLRKLLPYGPLIPLLGIYLDKTFIQKRYVNPMFI